MKKKRRLIRPAEWESIVNDILAGVNESEIVEKYNRPITTIRNIKVKLRKEGYDIPYGKAGARPEELSYTFKDTSPFVLAMKHYGERVKYNPGSGYVLDGNPMRVQDILEPFKRD